MKVTLYRFSGKENVVNKTLTAPVEVECECYEPVDPLNGFFLLGSMHDRNYAKFDYNGRHYAAFVNVASDSRGLHRYNCSVDSLTTAYLNGCMDVTAICSRTQAGGNAMLYDSELTYSAVNTRLEQVDTDGEPRGYVIINTIAGGSDTDTTAFIPGMDANYTGNVQIRNPMVKSIAMPLPVFKSFISHWYQLDADDQNNYGKSIQSAYFVPACISDFPLLGAFDSRKYIEWTSGYIPLTYFGNNGVGRILKVTYSAPAGAVGSVLSVRDFGMNPSDVFYTRLAGSVQGFTWKIDRVTAHAQITLHIPMCGSIAFSPADVGLTSDITSIGYRVSLDNIGGSVRAYLVVNGTMYKNYYVDANLPTFVPIPCDTSAQRWTDYLTAAISGAGAVTSIVAGAVSLGTANPAPLLLAGGITAGAGAAGSAITTAENHKHGAYTILNGVGSNIDLVNNDTFYVTMEYQAAVNRDQYQALYGKPDGGSHNIGALVSNGGYIRTVGAKLLHNGISNDIVSDAEGRLDAGVYGT